MKKKSLNLKLLKPYMKGNAGLLALSLVFALLSVSSKMAIPFVSGLAIDFMRGDSFTSEGLTPYLFLILALLLIGAAFRYIFDYVLSKCAQRIVKNMRDVLFDSFNSVPLSYLDTHPHGDLLLRLTSDIENVQTGLITGAGALFEGIVQILITLFFMFYLNWALALVVVFLTPISVLVSRYVSKSNSVYFKKQNAKMGELTAHTLETISNLEAIHAYGMEDAREEEFLKENEEVRKANFKATFASAWINPSTRLVNNLIYASITLLGALILINAPSWLGVSFTVGALSSFLSYSLQYMTPFNEIADVAKASGKSADEIKAICDGLKETNPMMGHRGLRLAVTYPEIAKMQTRAVIRAALKVQAAHKDWNMVPEIMIPLSADAKELKFVEDVVKATADEEIKAAGSNMKYEVGTMIEIPRAALTADKIAEQAEFFCFGTNDLTQMTFGFSRDDAGKFLGSYYDNKIFESDPFAKLDQEGVGQLMQMAIEKGKKTRPSLHCGICGEHGGDPSSVEFCHKIGLDYVSCSPFRVPVARLAAAQAAISEGC